jgi:NAD(P)-dependent dehydrogenase (short-subunit alcohol dehydrogenase family)
VDVDEPMAGRVVVITGANSGIGYEAAVALTRQGATVVITARDPHRGEQALTRVLRRTGRATALVMALDLASFASIRTFAADLLDRFDRLDVLINNAGAVLSDRRLTTEGFEMTFGVNHLGHFLLTDLLLDRLRDDSPSRIVNVASVAHRLAGSMVFADLQFEQRAYVGITAYNESKLANILFTTELARRLEGTGVTANACHPGPVRSGFGRGADTRGADRFLSTVSQPFLIGPKRGSKPLVRLASAPELAEVTGQYFTRWPLAYAPVKARARLPSRAARDPEVARRLWDESERPIASVSG